MALIQCPECGRQISDKATSCPNCGAPVEKRVNGRIYLTRLSSPYFKGKKVKVFLNGSSTVFDELAEESTLLIKTNHDGQYTIALQVDNLEPFVKTVYARINTIERISFRFNKRRMIEIVSDETENFSAENPDEDVYRNEGMRCPNCGSHSISYNTFQKETGRTTYTKYNDPKHGCLYWIFIGWWIWIFKAILWIFWWPIALILHIFKKEKQGFVTKTGKIEYEYVRKATCNVCGHTWDA